MIKLTDINKNYFLSINLILKRYRDNTHIMLIRIIPFIILFHLLSVFGENNANQPIVKTNCGPIKGSQFKSRLGRDFLGFRGIRYGKAPIGEFRFRAPQPVDSWEDVFDATEPGPMCPQLMQPDSAWSEDCLRLSVYTHNVSYMKSNLIFKTKQI